MTTTPLPLVKKSSAILLGDGLPMVLGRKITQAQMESFCRLYSRFGIADLLLLGEPGGFFSSLANSGRAFLYFLAGAPESIKLTSRSEPFFNAIACNDLATAKEIASHSRPTWCQGEEYEEDFLYYWFMMSRFMLGGSLIDSKALLARWEQALQGADDPRLPVCRALLLQDQAMFDAAWDHFIAEREREIAARLQSERMSPDDASTVAKVSVEVLALLRFAELSGLKTEEHYPLAPAVARRVELAKLPGPEAWRDV